MYSREQRPVKSLGRDLPTLVFRFLRGNMRLSFPVTPSDHVQGSASALVTLMHYGDFECPFSARVNPVIKRVQSELGDSLRYVFRSFPLSDVHPNAMQAALAAEAANAQGQFWPMHDLLFDNQDALETEDLMSYAQQLQLDVAAFERDLQNDAHEKTVRDFVASAKSMGVHGTPTFFINDEFHDNREGLWRADSLMQAISAALPEK